MAIVHRHHRTSARSRGIRCIAMLAIDASPLALSGADEAGGINTYVRGLAHGFACHGVATDVFTRATDPAQPPVMVLEPGVRVIPEPVNLCGTRQPGNC